MHEKRDEKKTENVSRRQQQRIHCLRLLWTGLTDVTLLRFFSFYFVCVAVVVALYYLYFRHLCVRLFVVRDSELYTKFEINI